MASILRRAAKYKRISPILQEGEAHLRDKFTPKPVILKPTGEKKEKSPEDISDFPRQQVVPMPEAIPYPEGAYRPASIPLNSGYLPYNVYLQEGKIYWYCTCGLSQNLPWCDSLCNQAPTRNRPMYFNVNESGYYKMCSCKFSANSPFCDNTHREVVRYYYKSHRGFYEVMGQVVFYLGWAYIFWNYYT